MIEDLKGKVVLVTGGSTGIGAEVAKEFAANGAKVMVHYNASEADAKAVVDAITAKGGVAQMVKGDVIDRSQPKKIVDATVKAFGRIDVLINNAGGMLGRKPLAELTDEQYDKVMDLNAWSVMAFTREVAPIMRQQGGGNIINTTSIAARNGGGGGAVLYAASKGFVSTWTRGMSKELWADKIRVNAVVPNKIGSPVGKDEFDPTRPVVNLVGRPGVPEDLANAVLFLVSEESSFIVGTALFVDGGCTTMMPGNT